MAREKYWSCHRVWISRTVLVAGFAASTLAGARSACSTCESHDIIVSPDDGSLLHARIFVPQHGETVDLPAVVVSHGYLGNSGFVEVPWAEDLTRLGIVALFVDRRGHGRSPGDWWPRHDEPPSFARLYPDIHAAVAHLRARRPLIDPARIALLGHSDGATGAVTAASADWEVAATISLSASLAPWEYANHVVPKNLLLLYGADDRFILSDTDTLLVKSATRGYLSGPGRTGNIEDGSARRLLRVAGFGHVDLVYSEEARAAALEWLKATFRLEREVTLAPTRLLQTAAGTLLLFLMVLFWNGLPAVEMRRENLAKSVSKAVTIALLWIVALNAAAWAGPELRGVAPAQEGSTVAALLIAVSLVMGGLTFVLALNANRREGRPAATSTRRAGGGDVDATSRVDVVSHARFLDVPWGACGGLLVQLALETAFRPVYTTAMTPQRLALAAMFATLTAPAFAVTCQAASWVGGNGRPLRCVPVELLLAALTATLTPWLFVRMSMLPAQTFALVLLFTAAYRAGGHSIAATAAFGATMYARAASVVCAFY